MICFSITFRCKLFEESLSIDDESYRRIKGDQKLTIEYTQFLQMLIKLFNSCHKEPNQYYIWFI